MPPKSTNTQQKGKQSKGGSSSTSSKAGPTWVAPKAITHPEHHHTLNHLHQVASYYGILSASAPAASSSDPACRLQGEMVRSAKSLSRKVVIRMDTGVKRGSCPKCDTVWVEGLTVSVRSRVSGPHDHVLKWRCGCCGTVARRPAPDLVPELKGEKAEAEEEGKGKKRDRGQEVIGEQPKVKRVPQRQRRRTASIKKQLSREAEASDAKAGLPQDVSEAALANPLTNPPKAKLSRKQVKQQRAARLAKRASSTSSTIAASSDPIDSASQAEAKADTVPAQAAVPDSPCEPTISAPDPPTAQSALKSPERKLRAPRPHLPHFNDRVQGSHWDDTFTKLEAQISAQPSEHTTPYAGQALQYWQKAARSRGDHLVVTGVGKNGALGPSLS
ncbi:RNAse P, Rpr2/Rpp21 subunit [Kalmanozyma brasiliensis GHG001]|uniref:RNAse P, Rpr2/Rpp21 subunit n=1 Tax=Kalmanozyma brasiliensis (strain GHG001) TaxID=1365824 RepID=UPI002867B27F|nr:RNAse P, Rpr2/Rpp21 subunit [Kalmanozyma brasiliensis GHG001]KAF6767067.1 RNAse P, Rpr2/Rpp21 subunit [Kalmanozyma brasiliensis GHG001]